MKLTLFRLCLLFAVVLVASCGPVYEVVAETRVAGGGYRVGEVAALKRKLSHTVFPQSDGYVESLLRDSARHGELVRTADLSGGADGLLAIYLVRYRLNESVNLMVYQHHYGAHRSPLSTAVVDARAEILPVKASSF